MQRLPVTCLQPWDRLVRLPRLCACAGGAVRQIDRRQAGGAPQALAALKHHLTGNLVEAHSISAPAHRPWLLAVGGSDPCCVSSTAASATRRGPSRRARD